MIVIVDVDDGDSFFVLVGGSASFVTLFVMMMISS